LPSRLSPSRPPPGLEFLRRLSGYLSAIVTVTAATVVSWFVFGEAHLTDVVMVFLLGVVVVSMQFGYGPSLLAAVLSVVAFEFFFIPPLFSFAVSDLRHFVTFAVMFLVAFVVSKLTKRIRDQAAAASARERDTARLYAASREIGLAHSPQALLASAARHAREMFGVGLAIMLPRPDQKLQIVRDADESFPVTHAELDEAESLWQQGHVEGEANLSQSTRALLVPLNGSRGRVGLLALLQAPGAPLVAPNDGALLDAFAGLVGSAVERTMLADEARRAELRAETEQLRSALLSSVSHDLRTPLAVVTGATSTLLERPPKDEDKRRALVVTAHEEALRLNRLVRNLLDMTRLEAGALTVRKELQPLEEVVGTALNRLESRLLDREVATSVPHDLPLVPFDSILIEQVLINLLENAVKHTPPSTPIEVDAALHDREIQIAVADRGPGVAKHDAERVFEKFYRAHEHEGGGVGLGLTICRGIVCAHGGRIWVEARPGGGASFRFTLPLDENKAGVDVPTSEPALDTGAS
jgi:two-component system sensor histidine kinase KdpD